MKTSNERRQNGEEVKLQQRKVHVSIPFAYSTAGYGLCLNMGFRSIRCRRIMKFETSFTQVCKLCNATISLFEIDVFRAKSFTSNKKSFYNNLNILIAKIISSLF